MKIQSSFTFLRINNFIRKYSERSEKTRTAIMGIKYAIYSLGVPLSIKYSLSRMMIEYTKPFKGK